MTAMMMRRSRRAAVALGALSLLLLAACAGAATTAATPTGTPPTPIPAATATAAGDAWAALRARPLHLPALAPGASCPVAQGRVVSPNYGVALGDGPVYPVGLDNGTLAYAPATVPDFGGGWGGMKVLWIASPAVRGAVLVRGGRLDGADGLRFERGADPPAELDLTAAGSDPDGWSSWPTYTRVRAPGCYAYEVDGSGFSVAIVFRVTPAA